MSAKQSCDNIAAITALLTDYFDGLYDGDLVKFARVFHPAAHLYSSDGTTVADVSLQQYFDVIAGRESPRSQSLERHDHIISIHQSGPDTALATVNCAMPPRYFTDYLTLLCTNGAWQIISKTYHTDTR